MLRFVLFFGIVLAISSSRPALAAPSSKTLLAKVAECRKKLKNAKIGTTEIGGHQAVLCVWKPGAKKVKLIQVRDGESQTKGFTVELLQRNGVNSLYKVEDDWLVMGIRTNVGADWKKGKKRRSTPAVYVPYGEHFDDDEIVKAGKRYLVGVAKQAAKRIDQRDVRSLYDPDKRLTETLSMKIAVTLLVIEHIDPDSLRANGVKVMMRRVLVIVGLNGGDAYNYALSSAQAGGIAQFLAETYERMRDEYPDAGLTKGFVAGMRDHANAVVAQYCLLDWSLNELKAERRDQLLKQDEVEIGAWLAAAYNTGANRAVPVYEEHGDDWDKPRKSGIPERTLVYVQEFRDVYKLLF